MSNDYDLGKIDHKLIDGRVYYDHEAVINWMRGVIRVYDDKSIQLIAGSNGIDPVEWGEVLFKSARLADAGSVVQGLAMSLSLINDSIMLSYVNTVFEGDK